MFHRFPILPTVILLLAMALGWLGERRSQAAPLPASVTAAPEPEPLYHADPHHLWNRLHTALLVRVGQDGKSYGQDRLEPLLWDASDPLATGPAAERLSAVLGEFLDARGEAAIDDPVKRAVLQRDLWRVASWMARDGGEPPAQLSPLARAMRRLALSPRQIANLPDNYAAAVKSKRFAARFDAVRLEGGRPTDVYLPADLFDDSGPWVCVGRTDGPTAPVHITGSSFANSAFLVLVKLPGGREAGLAFVRELAAQKKPMLLPNVDPVTGRTGEPSFNPDTPALPRGTELALVRRAMLIDSEGRIVVSRLTESVQLRVLSVDPAAAAKELIYPTSPAKIDLRQMAVFEVQLRREALFAGEAGGLIDVSDVPDFKTGFATHGWDQFTPRAGPGGASDTFPKQEQAFSGRFACFACHRSPTVYGTMSFQRHSPGDETLTERSQALFPVAEMTPSEVEEAAVRWISAQKSWTTVQKAME